MDLGPWAKPSETTHVLRLDALTAVLIATRYNTRFWPLDPTYGGGEPTALAGGCRRSWRPNQVKRLACDGIVLEGSPVQARLPEPVM